MKAVYKWRLQNGIYGYITDEQDRGLFVYDTTSYEREYGDGTIVSGVPVNDELISNVVSKMSKGQYTEYFNTFKSFIIEQYPNVSLLDITYYYNVENDECSASASALRCSATDILFYATAVTGDTLSVTVDNIQPAPDDGDSLKYRLDFVFPIEGGGDTDTNRAIKVDGQAFLDSTNKTALNLSGGTNVTLTTGANGTVVINAQGGGGGQDTNTWRKIRVNNQDFLGNGIDTESLTLNAGSNVTLTTGENGIVTISSQGGGGGTTYEQGRNITIDPNQRINAEGYVYNSGITSFAITGNTASSVYSFAEGSSTTANGPCSHAEGGLYLKLLSDVDTLSPPLLWQTKEYLFISREDSEFKDDSKGKIYATYNNTLYVINVTESVYLTDDDIPGIDTGDYFNVDNVSLLSDLINNSGVSLYYLADSYTGLTTTANGACSHAEGVGVSANGDCSHAEGYLTIASGDYSHAGGRYTIADKDSMTAIGRYNKTGVTNCLFAVGCGSYVGRNNALTVNGGGGKYSALARVNGVYDVQLGVPIGSIMMWPSSTAPTGWFICNGQEVSRERYSNLFSVCGTTYGAGNGSTTFNVPDFRGMFPIGAGQAPNTYLNSNNQNLGYNFHLGHNDKTVGEYVHSLGVSEMPSHSHTLKDFRILTDQDKGMGYDGCINSNTSSAGRKWKQFAPNGTKTDCVNTNFNNQTKFELNTAGSSGKHNNVPPYTCVNFIIKHS